MNKRIRKKVRKRFDQQVRDAEQRVEAKILKRMMELKDEEEEIAPVSDISGAMLYIHSSIASLKKDK